MLPEPNILFKCLYCIALKAPVTVKLIDVTMMHIHAFTTHFVTLYNYNDACILLAKSLLSIHSWLANLACFLTFYTCN